jgi:hypothetical protein
MLADIERTPGVAAITAGLTGVASIHGTTVDGLAGQPLRGPLLITIVNGRAPAAADEVALGTKTLRKVGAHIGSVISVTTTPNGRPHLARFRVVGTAVFPIDFSTGGLGTGAVFTLDGILSSTTHRCPPGPGHEACQVAVVSNAGGAFLVQAEPNATGRAAIAELSRRYPDAVNFPEAPTNLVNFGEAVNFPLIFGAAVALFGLATLAHLLIASVNRRRRDVALLKTLGFVRRQVAAAVSWQTTTVTMVGVIVGVPIGITVGRLAWDFFGSTLGVQSVTVVTGWAMAAVVLGALIAANLLAIGPALIAARSPSAVPLRAE